VTPELEPGRAIRLIVLGLRFRTRGVAHFLDEARHSPDRHSLSALAWHAAELRRYAESAPTRLHDNPKGD